MKRALQAILIAGEEMKADVLSDLKRITIREGVRDYTPGPVLIGCHQLNWATMKNIIDVKYYKLIDVPVQDYKDDGFETRTDMFKGLQNFYPNLTMDSEVTVVKWE